MVWRMACPTKRKGSDNWYYRRTIPADVKAIFAEASEGAVTARLVREPVDPQAAIRVPHDLDLARRQIARTHS
jgi:hypothetical protein